MNIDINFIRSSATVLVFVAFIGIVKWAWSAQRAQDFQEAAGLPLGSEEK